MSEPTAKTIKGIFIDARNQTVEPKEIKIDLPCLYKMLDCECVDFVQMHWAKDAVIIDDEGRLKDRDYGFALPDFSGHVFYGNGFVVGPPDHEGNETDSTILLNGQLTVQFLTFEEKKDENSKDR